MAWTYTGDPASSTRDAVRFYIGDTDSAAQQLQDAEIDFLLTESTADPYQAAVRAAETLAAKYARRADKTIGDLSISYSQISKGYRELTAQLKIRAALSGNAAAPYAGGISISDKITQENDSDRVAPAFTRDMHDSPEVQ